MITKTLFLSFNAAFIESEVTAKNQDDRALQGQPEYTANLIFGYDNIGAGHQLTVLLNQNGQAIADVGVSGQPDVFLEPRLDLNVVYRYEFSDSLTIRAKLENCSMTRWSTHRADKFSRSITEDRPFKSALIGSCNQFPFIVLARWQNYDATSTEDIVHLPHADNPGRMLG